MPRNSSGTYALYTPGNPVVPLTVISTTWANNTLTDIATAMTDSLSRSGDGGMLAPLEADSGAIGAPGYTWGAETTSGWYRASAGNFRYAIGGVDVVTITSAGITGLNFTGFANPSASVGLAAVNGSATTAMRSDGAPALSQAIAPTWTGAHVFASSAALKASFRSADTVGDVFINFLDSASAQKGYIGYAGSASDEFDIYNGEAAVTRLYANGQLSLTLTANTSITSAGVVLGPDGAVGAPAYSFSLDTNTGLYRNGTDQLSVACGGAQAFLFAGSINRSLGAFQVPDGDANNPQITFTSDIDTGLYRIGSDALGFTEGATGYRIGFRAIPRSTTATTLVVGDVGKCVAVSANIAIPISTFAVGDAVSVYNDSASSINITIAAGTLRLAGSTTTGTRALAARGIATLWFNVAGATPEVIASGPGLT